MVSVRVSVRCRIRGRGRVRDRGRRRDRVRGQAAERLVEDAAGALHLDTALGRSGLYLSKIA